MTTGVFVYLLLMLLLLGISFLCSLADACLSISEGPAGKWLQKDEQLSNTKEVFANLDDTLSGITLVNAIVNFGAAALSLRLGNAIGHPVTTIVGTLFLLLVGCEILPKTWALHHPLIWLRRLAPYLSFLLFFSSWKSFQRMWQWRDKKPLSISDNSSPKVETPAAENSFKYYPELLELAQRYGLLDEWQRKFIHRIISLDNKCVRDSMRPRSVIDVITVQEEYAEDEEKLFGYSHEEIIAMAQQFKHRYVPIFDASSGSVIGILNTRFLLLNPKAADWEEAIFAPPIQIPDSMNLLQLLKRLQSMKSPPRMLIVVDEFSEYVGVITPHDIFEEVVGEISSEVVSAEERIYPITDSNGKVLHWEAGGSVPITDLEEALKHRFLSAPQPKHSATSIEIQTVAGLVLKQLEYVPPEGTSVDIEGYRFQVVQRDFARIVKLQITPMQSVAATRGNREKLTTK